MRKPDRDGPSGRAYDLLGAPGMHRRPDHDASLASWLVNVPGAHPWWSWWMVACCHLRDMPGVRPASKHYPEAEHEFLIMTLDPEQKIDVDDLPAQGFKLLHPPDVVYQFDGVSDQDAARITGLAIGLIVQGQMSPDEDFRAVWKQLLAGTVQHFREGRHPAS